MTKAMNTETESDKTKLAVIANTLSFIQKDIGDIKTTMKDMSTAYLSTTTFIDFKKESDDKAKTYATKEEIDGLKRTYNLIGSAVILAVLGALFKVIFIH